MKTGLLWSRCIMEWVFGLFLLLGGIAQFPKAALSILLVIQGRVNIGYTLGTICGVFIITVFGFYVTV